MDLPRGSGRLGERLALGAVLITLAGVLYLVGTIGAAAVSCPAGGSGTGTEGAISFWPPGKECVSPAGGETTVEPLFGGIEWGIVGLALIAVALLLFAVVAEIRRLRQPPLGSRARGLLAHR